MPSTLNDSSPHGPLVITEKSPSEEMTFFNFSFFSPLIYLLTHVLVSPLILWKPEKLSSGRQWEETHLYPVLEKRRFVKTVFCASILEVCVRKRDLWRKSLNSNNKSCFNCVKEAVFQWFMSKWNHYFPEPAKNLHNSFVWFYYN